MTEIDFVPGPFSCRIEQQHLDFGAVVPSLLDYQTNLFFKANLFKI
jgi:hypothetical protein